MFGRFLIYFSCLIVLSGCIYREEPSLEIDYSLQSDVVQPTIPKPVVAKPVSGVPRDWVPPSYIEKRWTAIIIHHSATNDGNAAIFDKWHKESNNWDGIGYDFVIGNGSDSGDGQVEVTYRWRGQKTGAHTRTPNNWANEKAIGICLVGNFDKTEPTSYQLQSLTRLVRFLQARYSIPKNRIFGHRDTPGAYPTSCPGRMFPMTKFKSML